MKTRQMVSWGIGLVAFLLAGYVAIKLMAAKESPSALAAEAGPIPSEAKPAGDDRARAAEPSYDWQLPRESWKQAFRHERSIYFVNRKQSSAEWDALPDFWNDFVETVRDPKTGTTVQRKAVKIKVPLGLNQNPPVPEENPLTVAKWALGKRLYFDRVLSSDNTVACASCHDPKRGYTDQAPVSTGIKGQKGGISAPTVINTAFNLRHFWDGRASSLEDQAQGPPQNPKEMFNGEGNAWHQLVERVRRKEDYRQRFREAFGTEPTRDAIVKAIACYERTVLSGGSIHDRAELAMHKRVDRARTGPYVLQAKDYETVLREAVAKKDVPALAALGIDLAKDAADLPEIANGIRKGRELFHGKARCSSCHSGDNFTDNQFHNLGVGVKEARLSLESQGRFALLPTGHKNPELMGAFKTPTLRGLVKTAPYLHNGSAATLEDVIDFYDQGGEANEFLAPMMRNLDQERAYELSRQQKTPHKGPKVQLCGKDQKPIIPRRLRLTAEEKQNLVLFLKALQGDPVDPIVADKDKMPPVVGATGSDKRR